MYGDKIRYIDGESGYLFTKCHRAFKGISEKGQLEYGVREGCGHMWETIDWKK